MNRNINYRKRISVALAEKIEKPLLEYKQFYVVKEKEGYLIYLADKDVNSDLYFGITEEKSGIFGEPEVNFESKPYSNTNNKLAKAVAKNDTVLQCLTEWLGALKFQSEKSVLNISKEEEYSDEFYSCFEIKEDDADTAGFSYKQQRELLLLFERIVANIDAVKDGRNDAYIEEMKVDLVDLQNSVGSETKNGLMKKFSDFLGKAREKSFKACDFVLKEFLKEVLKEGVKYSFKYLTENGHKLPDFMDGMIN